MLTSKLVSSKEIQEKMEKEKYSKAFEVWPALTITERMHSQPIIKITYCLTCWCFLNIHADSTHPGQKLKDFHLLVSNTYCSLFCRNQPSQIWFLPPGCLHKQQNKQSLSFQLYKKYIYRRENWQCKRLNAHTVSFIRYLPRGNFFVLLFLTSVCCQLLKSSQIPCLFTW